MSLKKVVVVTGVGRGLGRAMTNELVRLRHVVAGCARSPQAIDELRNEHGDPHHFSVVDVTDADAVSSWAENVVDAVGCPDLLLNNAGLINQNNKLWEVPHEEFSSVVDVNIKGVFHVIRSFVPMMVARGTGVIVNFSSGWGRSTSPEVAPYCATKWGIEGMTQAMADELPRGMAAVALNPGIIHTDMLQSCFGGNASAYPGPSEWAERAVPYILRFGPRHNGAAETAP